MNLLLRHRKHSMYSLSASSPSLFPTPSHPFTDLFKCAIPSLTHERIMLIFQIVNFTEYANQLFKRKLWAVTEGWVGARWKMTRHNEKVEPRTEEMSNYLATFLLCISTDSFDDFEWKLLLKNVGRPVSCASPSSVCDCLAEIMGMGLREGLHTAMASNRSWKLS